MKSLAWYNTRIYRKVAELREYRTTYSETEECNNFKHSPDDPTIT